MYTGLMRARNGIETKLDYPYDSYPNLDTATVNNS